jgi:hypothetical protein
MASEQEHFVEDVVDGSRLQELTAQGWRVVERVDRERTRDASGLVGLVVIDGEMFECVGVERHALAGAILPGEPVGLWVRELPEDVCGRSRT